MTLTLDSEKRQKPRFKTAEAYLEIYWTFPRGTKLICEVIDINESGLAFKMLASEGCFPPGTPLRRIKLFQPHAKKGKTLAGVVRHTRAFHNDGELCYKIGIELVKINVLSEERSTVPFPIRPKRYTARKYFKQDSQVNFFTIEGAPYTGRLIDFSRYGAAVELFESIPLVRISDTLKQFRIAVESEVVYLGEATVVRLKQEGDLTHLGIVFKDSVLDLSKIFSLHHKSDLDNKFKTFMSNLSFINEGLTKDFKSAVADLRFFLERIKSLLEGEKKLIVEDNDINANENILLKNILEDSCKYVADKIGVIRVNTQDLSEEEQEHYRSYFRHHLLPLFFECPFLNRGFHKPLGYAGDYQLMNFLYKDGLLGKGLFAKFLDSYCYTENSAKAVMNRVPYLVKKITEYLTDNHRTVLGRKPSIMSVGSGPAKEIQKLVESTSALNGCQITLVDSDSESLLYAQDQILNLRAKFNRKFDISFIPCSVAQLMSDNYKLPKQDIIYSIGLFDYLEDALAKALIKKLYDSLNENGLIIIGNVDPSNKTRFFIEYVMDWYIIYRDAHQLENLASGIRDPKSFIHLECEDTETNNFMVIRKK